MRVVLTGATGFIGRRLVDYLLCQGHDVTVITRQSMYDGPKDVHVIHGDFTKPEPLKGMAWNYDRLYHLAALVTFDPLRRKELMQVNGEGTAQILSLAKDINVARSVVVSSACTFGVSASADILLTENNHATPAHAEFNAYLASKVYAEELACKAAAEGQWVTIVNPTTVYGPGDYSLNSGTLIKTIADSRCVIPVPCGGSNCVDVDDVVSGIVSAGERGESGHRYILGGENLTYGAIFKTIANTVGRNPFFLKLPSWFRIPMAYACGCFGYVVRNRFLTHSIINDMFYYKYFSSSLAHDKLEWKSVYSFRQSVERAWEFYRSLQDT